MLVIGCKGLFLLKLSIILLYGYTTIDLLIHQLKDILVVSSLAVMNKTAIKNCV